MAEETKVPETEEVIEEKAEVKEKKPKKESASKKEIAKLKEELETQKDMYLRLAAEYDNFRRRSQTEKEAAYGDAYADALKALLPTVDNLERALKYPDSAKVVEGVQMTYNKLQQSLTSLGIEEIPCEIFDPNYHNAVMHVEDEAYGESAIVEVFEKGYKRGDKVIRYAMVKVAN